MMAINNSLKGYKIPIWKIHMIPILFNLTILVSIACYKGIDVYGDLCFLQGNINLFLLIPCVLYIVLGSYTKYFLVNKVVLIENIKEGNNLLQYYSKFIYITLIYWFMIGVVGVTLCFEGPTFSISRSDDWRDFVI